MLSILCPHCQTKLTVEEQWQGRTINCINCAQQLAVPAVVASTAVDTSPDALSVGPVTSDPAGPAISISTDSTSIVRKRKKAIGNRIISTALHLSITAATVYAGYYLVTQRKAKAPQPTVAAVQPQQQKKPKKKQSAPRPRKTATLPQPVVELVEEPAPIEVVAAPVSPFVDSPTSAILPATDDTEAVTLADGFSEIEFRLVSNATALSQSDRKIHWQDADTGSSTVVAGLAMIDGALKFRWMADVPEVAEAAIRNSIVTLSHNEFQHPLCLRSAESIQPLQVDLRKSQQKIVSKCEFLPVASEICFELLDLDRLPASTVDGADPARLQLRDQTTLHYLEAEGAATRLTMKKRGKVVVVNLESRYALPSGDEHPMSISLGNNKVKELDALYHEALAAEAAISDLRNQLKQLQKDAKAVPRSRATAMAKTARLNQLQSQIGIAQQNIAYAERLLGQKAAIEADYKAIQNIAKLAQKLHETKLAYRFYTIVDGHEVDLLMAR